MAEQMEQLNGCNLYAYCLNNPIMGVDPEGTFIGFILAGFLIGALFGGYKAGKEAEANGGDFWLGFASGAVMGGVLGAVAAVGGAIGSGAIALSNAFIAGGCAMIASFAAGAGSYALEQAAYGRDINLAQMQERGFVGLFKGISSFATGLYAGKTGLWSAAKGKEHGFLSMSQKLTSFSGVMNYLKENCIAMVLKFVVKLLVNQIADDIVKSLE